MLNKQILLEKRNKLDQFRYGTAHSVSQAQELGHSILSSWQRSRAAAIPQERSAAPLVKLQEGFSPLQQALAYCSDQLKNIAEQSSMALAVADVSSTIIWSATQGAMQRAAEKVHFMEGGQWREEVVGTNALDLSLKTKRSLCVFSNEHYMSSVQDWACYAAPILDPYSKHVLGVIDLSVTWDKHNTLGLLAAERCASIVQDALREHQRQQLYIRAFAVPQVLFNGKSLVVTPRQIEILTILALCPQGLNLQSLHQALYGERKVSMGTLKAEISQLRELLGGMLGSRPYRLLTHVMADFLQAEQALDAADVEAALQLCTGGFLVKTESPFLRTWRDCLESRLSHVIYSTHQTEILLKYVARFPEAVDAVERLIELMPKRHPMQDTLCKLRQSE